MKLESARGGFTLIELVIVVSVMGLGLALALPQMKVSPLRKATDAASVMLVDLDLARTRALSTKKAARVVFDQSGKSYVGFLDDNGDGSFDQSAAETAALRGFGQRSLSKGIAFGRGSAPPAPDDPAGSGAVTFTDSRVEFSARGVTQPFGTRGVIYLVAADSPSAVAGDFARLQVADTRRVILVKAVSTDAAGAKLAWTGHGAFLRYAAGLSDSLLLDRFNTFVQKLAPIVYYVDGENLMRAQSFDASSGKPAGDVIGTGVKSWDVKVIFADGTEGDLANPYDADPNNDFEDVVGVRITAALAAERSIRGFGGAPQPMTRKYEWRFAPRNLMYERNRI